MVALLGDRPSRTALVAMLFELKHWSHVVRSSDTGRRPQSLVMDVQAFPVSPAQLVAEAITPRGLSLIAVQRIRPGPFDASSLPAACCSRRQTLIFQRVRVLQQA